MAFALLTFGTVAMLVFACGEELDVNETPAAPDSSVPSAEGASPPPSPTDGGVLPLEAAAVDGALAPGFVACNGGACPPGQECCGDENGFSCVVANTCDLSKTRVTCDDSRDCDGGNFACWLSDEQGRLVTKCTNNAVGRKLCKSQADCDGGICHLDRECGGFTFSGVCSVNMCP